jgi:hypothetical protein
VRHVAPAEVAARCQRTRNEEASGDGTRKIRNPKEHKRLNGEQHDRDISGENPAFEAKNFSEGNPSGTPGRVSRWRGCLPGWTAKPMTNFDRKLNFRQRRGPREAWTQQNPGPAAGVVLEARRLDKNV